MPDMRIVDPDHGDITEDVARELAILRQQETERIAAKALRRQRHIAATCGQESVQHKAAGLRLVAQIDEGVFSEWERREGAGFWQHELAWMCKRHPELAVRPFNPNPVFGYRGPYRVRGKRGRWAA